MADEAGDLEGEPFGTVDFCVVQSNGKLEVVTLDVGLKSPLIGGHKQDFADMFQVEGQVQAWKYNGKILQDEKSLWDYDINGTEPVVITVTVS